MAEMRDEKRSDRSQPLNTQRETQLSRPRQQGGLATRGFFDPFGMFREMDRLLQNLGMPALGAGMERSLWSPQIELFEEGGKLHVKADLPGLSKNDVHCEVRDNMLILEGERKQEQKDERGGWSERSYGRFFRQIPLPETVNPDSAKASFKDGVLEITLDAPKKMESGKKIEIS